MRRSTFIFFSILLIAIGGASGAWFHAAWAKHHVANESVESAWQKRALSTYEKELGLDSAQIERLRPKFKAVSADLREVRLQTARTIQVRVRQLQADVRAELTPSQQARFDKLISAEGADKSEQPGN